MNNSEYILIADADELRGACEHLTVQAAIGFDTETTSLDPYDGRLRLIQFAAPNEPACIIDLDAFRTSQTDDLTKSDAVAPLRQLLAAARPIKIAHNAKFDAKWIRHTLGVDLGGVFDTMLASQIVSGGDTEDRHNLAAVAARYLDETIDKSEQLSDWGGELSGTQLEYAGRDATVMLPLREALIQKLKHEDLIQCAALEFECVMPIAALEHNGIFLDTPRWREQMKRVERQRAILADELQAMLAEGSTQGSLFESARVEVNIDSHTQLSARLKALGVPVPDSTRNWKLQPLAKDYPVVAKLLEYRTVQKSLTSYGANILEEINPQTKRIHANFHQIGAPTGRMSCTNPNVQQIPHDVEYRRCFRAPQGRKLLIADYSQIELRILADMTGDEGFINAFQSGADLHRTTAAQVFNIKPEEVTSDQRSFAKRLNFGVVYGIGAQRFSMMTGISVTEAEELLRRYFATYPKLDAWLRDAARRAVRERTARTYSGRIARFNFDMQDKKAVSLAQRNGKNMPVQGSSADILKRALRLLHDDLQDTSARIVNVVHDEIVVEVDDAQAAEIVLRVEKMMCEAGAEFVKRVPIKVESVIADEWVK